jgi:hypothetical protein
MKATPSQREKQGRVAAPAGILPEGWSAPRANEGLRSPPALSQLVVPGEQDGGVVVQRVSVPFHVDALLPLAEAPQGVVCMVCDL